MATASYQQFVYDNGTIMRIYQQLVYDAAKDQGKTAEDLRAMGRQQIAALAGVDTKVPNFTFSWQSVKHYVLRILTREERAVVLEEQRAVFQSAIRALPVYDNVEVEITDDGELRIKASAGVGVG